MIIDLFRGPGGWCTGLRMLGITDVHGIDNDPHAHATATAAGHKGQLADITTLDPRDYVGEVRGQISSPPCPGFSAAGKGDGRKDLELLLAAVADLGNGTDPATVLGMVRAWQRDDRSALTLEPLHWALITRPSWIAFEQVPAVLPVWEACATVLRGQGYSTWTGKVYAEQYGVPQTRRRAVMLASLNRVVGRPAATHSLYYGRTPDQVDPGMAKWVSMAEALGWGMTGRPSMTVTGGGTNTGGAEPFGNAARQGMRREMAAGHWAYRRPATTVLGDPRLGRPGHKHRGPDCCKANATTGIRESQFAADSIRISVQEAALLQTFPADYPWQGNQGQRHMQVGNAVPPLLAAHLIAELGVGVLPATQLLATA